MNGPSWILAFAVLALSAGCDRATTQQKVEPPQVVSAPPPLAAPQLDMTTPDRALKSYWAYVDWDLDRQAESSKQFLNSADYAERREVHEKVAVRAIVDDHKGTPLREIYQREILSATVETESRAVIAATIKNVTPLPQGMTLEPLDRKKRDDGQRFRYVMEREGSNWKVAEIWAYESFLSRFERRSPSRIQLLPIYVHEGY